MSKERLEGLIEVRGKVLATKLSPTNLKNSRLGYMNDAYFEVLAIDSLADTDWRSPIINYLKDPIVDAERKVKYRALSYVLIGNELFKKTPRGSFIKMFRGK